MSSAIRSKFAMSVAIAGAGGIALSALAPLPQRAVPAVHISAVELAAASAPALGAIPYQILINQLGDAVALAPILFGSTEQCPVCLGPSGPEPVPFTGYGAVGIAAGLLTSPVAFVESLSSTGNILAALGTAELAVRTPITNTFLQLIGPRSLGGFNLEGTFNREFTALNDAVTGILAITAQALVTGPVTVIGGAVSAGQLFAGTLAATGDFAQALGLSRAVLRGAIDSAGADLVAVVADTRAQIYTDLTANAPTAAATAATTMAATTMAATTMAAARTPRAARGAAAAKAGSTGKPKAAAAAKRAAR